MAVTLKKVIPEEIGCGDDCGFRVVYVIQNGDDKGISALKEFIAEEDVLLIGDTVGHGALLWQALVEMELGGHWHTEEWAMHMYKNGPSRKIPVAGNLKNGEVATWKSEGYQMTTPEEMRPAVESLLRAVIATM